MYFNVKEKAVCAGTIPALLIEPATIKKDIVLIYYHGWGSSVTSSRFRASIWAAAGYPVLIVEESLHDSRGSCPKCFYKISRNTRSWQST